MAASLAVGSIALAPRSVGAAEDLEPVSLPGEAYSAVVVDIDEDGASDLVRIRRDGRTRHVIEAWSMGAAAPALLGSHPIPMVAPDGDDARAAGSDASGLVLWHLGGRVRVLAIGTWAELGPSASEGTCCLAILEVDVTPDGLSVEERPVDPGRAEVIQAADLDGDGTDELIRRTPIGPEPAPAIEILRWDGAAFRSGFVERGPRAEGPFWVGDSDGVAGDDLLFGPSRGGEVLRVTLRAGVPRTEFARVPVGEGFDGWIAGIAEGSLVMSSSSGLQLIRWPNGEGAHNVARAAGAMFVTGIVNGQDGALIAMQGASPGPFGIGDTLKLYDANLRRLGEIRASPAAMALGELLSQRGISTEGWQRFPWPYTGPFLAADASPEDDLVWNGVLITTGGQGGYETSPIALMPNMQPIGRIGPDDGWIAMITGYVYGATTAYLFPDSMPSGYGGITLTPVSDVVDADPPAGSSVIDARGAVLVSEPRGATTELIAPGDGFDAVVRAPPGSWLATWNGADLDEQAMAAGTETIHFAPGRTASADENAPIRAAVIVTTPEGHVTVVAWSGSFVREPPPLRVEEQTDTFSFAATLEGDVDGPGTTVEVDGEPVATNPAGQFELSIGAVPWPHDVVVTVRDAVGNVTTERVQVIGLLDYRGLPWAVIAVAATIGAGALLFARIPRGRFRSATGTPDRDGDGRLEELDLDDIEAITEPGRSGR
jgi:hypothetical protein